MIPNPSQIVETAAFDQGVLWTVARLVEMYDQPSMACELLRESGADIKQADGLDAPFIAKALEAEPASQTGDA